MVKRVLLGAIVAVVVITFVVVLTRVSQALPKVPAPPPEKRQTVLKGFYTGYDPDTNEKSFQVTWESARRRADKKIEVSSPRVVIFRPSGGEIIITATEGLFEEETYDGKLIGNIIVETDDGTRAITEEIEWYRDEERDEKRMESASPVTLENDVVQVSGTGLRTEDDLNKIIVLEDGEVRLKRGVAGLFPSEEEQENQGPEQQTPPLFVTCDGPLMFDRANRLITFSDNVRLWQESAVLTADNLEVFYRQIAEADDPNQAETEIEKIEASGNVHWKDGERSAFCQDLIYEPTTKILYIRGRPLVLKDGQDKLETREVLVEQEKGRLSTPGGGRLTLVRQGGFIPGPEETRSGKNESYEVSWDGDWLYDTRAREVSFRENVRLVSEDLNLSSQSLWVAFKEEAEEEEEEEEGPLRVEAAGDVVVVTTKPEGILRGDEFIYDGKKKVSTMRGNPAEFSWPSTVSGAEGKKQNILRASTIYFETELGNAHAEGQGNLVFHTQEDFVPKAPPPGETAPTPLKKEIPSQVEISWKDKASFTDNFNHLVFFKDVEIVRGSMTIRAQKFEIILQKTEAGERTLSQASAREEVLIKGEDFEARGNSLLRKEKIARLEGTPLAEVRQGTSLIRSDTIEWDEQNQLLKTGAGEFTTIKNKKDERGRELPPERTDVRWKGQMFYDQGKGEALFREDTELIGPEGVIKADTLQMGFEKKNNNLLWLLAQGNVFVEEKNRKARCNDLFWDATKRMAILTGAPEVELWEGENRTLWRKVSYYAEEDRVVLEGGAYVTTTPK